MRPASARGGGWNRSRTGKPKHKRPKPQGSSDSYASPPGPPRQPPLAPDSSWPSSESSQLQMGVPYPPMPPVQTPYLPLVGAGHGGPQQAGDGGMVLQMDPAQQSYQQNLGIMQLVQNLQAPSVNMNLQAVQMQSDPSSTQNFQSVPIQNVQSFANLQPLAPPQGINPYMTPVMAVILPNYPTFPPAYPSLYPPSAPPLLPQAPFTMAGFAPEPSPFSQPQFQAQPAPQPPQPPPGPLVCSPRAGSPLAEEEEGAAGPPDWAPMVSSSRSSSPLQLNLLQEELPKPSEGAGGAARTHTRTESLREPHAKGDGAPSDAGNHDAQSTSSEMLDLLLQEDARSGTGSNASGSGVSRGSLGSGSNGTSTSHTGSSNSSKYFASNDSSDTSRKARRNQEAAAADPKRPSQSRAENSLWTLIQRTPEPVMMTYQIRLREQSEVLAEDREKLHLLQPLQPWFTQEQREELAEVHPWIQHCSIPQEIDTQGCESCTSRAGIPPPPLPPDPDSSSPSLCPQSDCSPTLDT